ncbi:winged helix-turn-helix domain-containing protein [Inquilinus limosus]|uniref:winged helix-turn-helix domain-containing protein n=1 Tax=Inquilinus limosus TaxID=171674 RepID=UPI003F1543BB
MDTYLEIAATILRAERRPLSSRAILAAAYRHGCVPAHLYGKTQHKTLGARLSEDIIAHREESLFFRTMPGRFFLREFLDDNTIPEEFRQPIAVRRRVRELLRGPALALSVDDLAGIATSDSPISPERVLRLLHKNRYRYDDPKDQRPDSVFLWSFVAVRRDCEVLTYRLGRYRDDRDTFMSRRSVGFSTLVSREQSTLFNIEDLGIVESGVNAAKMDLDVPVVRHSSEATQSQASLTNFIWVEHERGQSDLLAVISFRCPDWFHPERRRLSLNDVSWLDMKTPVNNIDDFDPWSRCVLMHGEFNKIQ